MYPAALRSVFDNSFSVRTDNTGNPFHGHDYVVASTRGVMDRYVYDVTCTGCDFSQRRIEYAVKARKRKARR